MKVNLPEGMRGFDYSGLALKGGACADLPDSALLQSAEPGGSGGGVPAWRGVVTVDNWKYACFEHQPWLMFNLDDDPWEQVNLVFQNRCRVERRRLHERLRQWLADLGDGFALPAR